MITLYNDSFWISPYGFSCFVALREKGLEFQTRPVSLPDKEHHKADYQRGSLTGRVPALEHDGFWVSESSAIIEYLEEVFPQRPLFPEAPRERARARQIMAWVRSDLMPIREERPTTSMFYGHSSVPLSGNAEDAAARLLYFADAVVPEGKTQLFDSFSIADADLAFMLQRLALNGRPLAPKLRAFVDAQWARPSVREFVDRERLPFRPY